MIPAASAAIWLTMLTIAKWASEDALNAHLSESFVQKAVLDVEPFLAGPLELHVYKPI